MIDIYISRKERKKLRKLNRPNLLRQKEEEEIELRKHCKLFAKELSKGEIVDINKKFKCPDCLQFYCITFSGTQQFCRDCWYNDCCLKLSVGGKQCRKCANIAKQRLG